MADAGAAPVGLRWWCLLTCCWVLALIMNCQSVTGASRLPTVYQRGLLSKSSSNKPQTIRAELIHRDHPESPLHVPHASTSVESRASAAWSRHHARMARRRRLVAAPAPAATAVEFTAPISSANAEEVPDYITTLFLGTPVQKFFLLVDTGSDLMWVQCKPCGSPYKCYNETNPVFDPSASSSYSAVPCASSKCNSTQLESGGTSCNSLNNCHITYAYLKVGSGIAGQLSTETISFDNSSSGGQLGVPNFLFGCMNNNTATFGTVDGIVGFGRGPFSLPSQLSELTSVNVFSYCLVPFVDSTNLTSPLVFGVAETNNSLVYTPILTVPDFPTFYWVNMTGVSINGMDVSIPQASLEYNSSSQFGGTVFDSGTPLLVLNDQDVWTSIVQIFENLITYPIVLLSNVSLCYNISGLLQPGYPTMVLHFSGLNGTIVDFPLSGENLFVPYSDDVECLTISPPIDESPSFNIIGNTAQADHYIETNVVNMKIGWTSRDCSLPM